MQTQINKLITAILLSLCALVCITIYFPGLYGGFYFDDNVNIIDNHFLYFDSLTFSNLWLAMTSDASGLIKRIIPTLTFSLNIYFADELAFAMKATNLAIHIATSALVFIFLSILFKNYSGIFQSKDHKFWFALTIAFAWLIHPFNLTSVLYIVQRMTSLSAFFCMLALISYIYFRNKQLEDSKWTGLIICTSIFGILALLCKENAVLIPYYILAIEIFILKFKAKNLRDTKLLKLLISLSALLPVITAALLLYAYPSWLTELYATREFTLEQRILSQLRVIAWYIQMIIIPDIGHMGLLLDDIKISQSLLNPITTLYSGLFIILLLALIIKTSHRLPLVAFGLSWYFIGHTIESTFLPLELAFEHRNYLPSIGLLSAFCYLVYSILVRTRKLQLCMLIITTAWLCTLSITTYLRAENWKNPATLALFDVERHPSSSRANVYAATVFVNLGLQETNDDKKKEYIKNASNYYIRAQELDSIGVSSSIGRIIALLILKEKVKESFILSTINKLKNRTLDASTHNSLISLTQCHLDGFCNLPTELYDELMNSAINNLKLKKSFRPVLLVSKARYHMYLTKNFADAEDSLYRAIKDDEKNIAYQFSIAELYILKNEYRKAREKLKLIEDLDKLNLYNRELKQWNNTIDNNLLKKDI